MPGVEFCWESLWPGWRMLQGSAVWCGGTAGHCHCVTSLCFPSLQTWEPSRWWLCLGGFSSAAPFALGLGWSQHWKLSYTVAPAPLKYTCLKLQGNGLKKCSWVIKINEAWQDAASPVRCDHGVVDVHAEDAASEQGLVDGAQGSGGSGPALTLCLLSCCSAAPLQSSLLPLAFLLCACDSSRS